MENGIRKGYAALAPQLGDAQASTDDPNQNTVISFRKLPGLRLAMLRDDLFPAPGSWPTTKQVALVGRSNRPYANNQPTHRLRLDRYDDVDFEQLREKMVADGLWVLAGTECVKS